MRNAVNVGVIGIAVSLSLLTVALAEPPAAPVAGTPRAASAPGVLEGVTVYRGQAQVTRSVEVDGPAGPVELVVTDLPTQVISYSLSASADGGGVQVRSVRYRTTAVQDEPREEVRKIDEQLDEIQKGVRKIQAAQSLLAQKTAYLDNLEKFTAEKTKDDMSKGTLNAQTVLAVTELIFKQRDAIASESLELSEQLRTANEKQNYLQRQRAELAGRSTRTLREAVVLLDKANAGKSAVKLSYLVEGATWSPMYNARATGKGKDMALECNAQIRQTSGENWQNVKLTLSTASPAMLAEAPLLTPLWVSLGARADGRSNYEVFNAINEAQSGRRDSLAKRSQAATQPAGAKLDADMEANRFASQEQLVDLIASKDVLLAGKESLALEGALSVSYVLPGAINLPSRPDQQMVQIASLKMPAEMYYQAAPLLTSYVYQQADVINDSEIALLAGPVQSYMDGQFMGAGTLPMVAKGQRFTVGFGVDSQLRVARELVDKTDTVQGGNRELTFNYRLLVSNFKDVPVKVRLLDRIPDPTNHAEIRVTLLSPPETDLSKDPVYLRSLRPANVLRWDIEVPAKASGATAKTIEYKYKAEFDRNLGLTAPQPAVEGQKREEFRQMLQMPAK